MSLKEILKYGEDPEAERRGVGEAFRRQGKAGESPEVPKPLASPKHP